MDSHSLSFLSGKSSFGFSSYLDTNYLARRIISNRSRSEDSAVQFHKMDMKQKVKQPCQFISGNNLVNHLEGRSKKNSYQGLLQQDHLNIMPISSTFLIGGYVGSKSQKENANRTRLNVRIQDFIFNKLVDLMGNAVHDVTKCPKDLTKAGDYAINVTCTGKKKYTDLTEVSEYKKEVVTENHQPTQIHQSLKMSSHGKQTYADVTKTSVQSTMSQLPGLKSETEQHKVKVKQATQSRTNQYVNSNIKFTAGMKRDCNPKPRPTLGISLNHHIINSGERTKGLDTLCYKKNKQKKQGNDKAQNKSVNCELSRLGIDLLKYKKSEEPVEKMNEKKTSCMIGLTKVFSKMSIQSLERNIDLMSDNDNRQDLNNLEDTSINFQSSEKTPENIFGHSVLFELPSKNDCDITNNTSVPVTSKQDVHQLVLNRNRAASECSIDSEDSFIIFANDCDHTSDNRVEETDDIFYSDDSSDDGFCDKDCWSWTQRKQQTLEICSLYSKKNEINPKKKVRFADERALVKVHRMVVWDYAHRMARIGPWETCARDSVRFKARICQIGAILSPILGAEHRQQIFHKRFSSEL